MILTDDVIYNGFVISQLSNGSFRVTKNDGSDKHTHLKHLSACYKLIDNVNECKIPKRCNLYYIESHIRLVDDDSDYKRKLQEFYDVKVSKGKKDGFYRPMKNF